MPRTLDVVVRGDTVERAKAGDNSVFTGEQLPSGSTSCRLYPPTFPRAHRRGCNRVWACDGCGPWSPQRWYTGADHRLKRDHMGNSEMELPI